jgi:predicted nucleotidyltransferase
MADPRTIAAKLTVQLRTVFAAELKSVVLFGSLARGEAIPGVSDLNLLVLLDSLATPTLMRAAPVLQQWIYQGNTPPYVYSWNEWQGMQSGFAIEIADMHDARELLWGIDPIAVDSISHANLRMQTDREIRDTLLHLRLRLMVAVSGPADIGALLLSGFPSFAAYMRSALRLTGESPGLSTRPVVERVAALIGADPSAMLECHDARQTTHRLDLALTDPMVDRYMDFAHRLLDYINALPATAGTSDGGPGGPGVGGGDLSFHRRSVARTGMP